MFASLLLAATVMAAPEKTETDAIFRAAGAMQHGDHWMWSHGDPKAKLRIDLYRDLNGDGLIDVVVVEDASRSFALVAQGPKGKWRKLYAGKGAAEVLDARKGSWPDIRIAGSGKCHPVMRWSGKAYVQHRTEYLGKPCKK
jgi:hypothetical protein